IHDLIDRCLKKDKTQRFRSGVDLETELRQLQGARSPAAESGKSGNQWRVLAAAILLAAVLGILVLFFHPFSRSTPTETTVHSIAVMSFRTVTDDRKAGSFAVGLPEALGDALAKQGFLVAARSSTAAFEGGGSGLAAPSQSTSHSTIDSV